MKIRFRDSIQFKIILLFLSFAAVLIFLIYGFMYKGISDMEEYLIAERLNADIVYLESSIGEGDWKIKDGCIYRGDVLIGDGTIKNANLEPFEEFEEKTGTFAYVFIKCSDDELGYVESTETQDGYTEGHFKRVAGSTLDPNGNVIVGTYIDVLVADILDKEGVYQGEANVAGGHIYCVYRTLIDENGEVVGAIVVGRSISALKNLVETVIEAMIGGVAIIILIICGVVVWIITRWTNSLKIIANRLKLIEDGELPKEPLVVRSYDEMGMLVERINSLVTSLDENETLRIAAQTDELTGLANRLGLRRYSKNTFEYCIDSKRCITVGILDIDCFKEYNDNYGHQAGDECITKLSDILKSMRIARDLFCARFGGDEFIIICDGYNTDDIKEIAEQIKKYFEDNCFEHKYSNVSDHITVSQGYCYGVPKEGEDFKYFMHYADIALYDVKKNGKNNYKIINMEDENK
ncbi:MAG: diguanylate cyclase [Eubacterium sp.]|nr:diguanylate cyclase [Eubacterium sp.]